MNRKSARKSGWRSASARRLRLILSLGLIAVAQLPAPAAFAYDQLVFRVESDNDDLRDTLRAATLLSTTRKDAPAADVLAAARADYARLLSALYGRSRYGATISILLDGREAAGIAPLDAPDRISRVEVIVESGPAFRFGRAEIAPLPRGAVLPDGFATGDVALSGTIADATEAGIAAWRKRGHARARVAAEDITADHPARRLDVAISLDRGPVLRFGRLSIEGAETIRERRVRKIAGLPEGRRFDPDALRRAADRLRRSGVFQSVTLTEDTAITPPDLIGITATLVEEKPRRYRFGAEIASLDGIQITAGWLHRNLLGGGERLSIDGAISNIGAQSSGVDYSLGVAIERPATLTPDTTARLAFGIEHLDEDDYRADAANLSLGFRHVFSDQLTARAALTYSVIDGEDEAGAFRYRNLALPVGATWDRRDDPKDARRGFFIDAEAQPFLGFGTTGSGLRATLDLRGYRSFGAEDRATLAARIQAGSILGAPILDVPRDMLFYSGGGGTVRGHPYQSLGIPLARGPGLTTEIGGTTFLGLSVELRGRITDRIGLVGFADAGFVSADGFDAGDWHSGAGIGLRYETGLGPIRVDVATPVSGRTGDGVQFYVGLGQSF